MGAAGMSSWEESYLGQLRQLVGSRRLLTTAVRGFIVDDHGRLLFIRRRDNGLWGLPAGAMELGETVLDALKREVKEETGVDVLSAILIATYSGPRFAGTDAWGNDYQLLLFQFRVDEWTGSLVKETDETVDAGFFSEDELPEAYEQYSEALEDLEIFTGDVILK